MSTFKGRIDEFPGVSVDRFDGENQSSTVYFLSHCHTDHMNGLGDPRFQQSLLNRPGVFLYASPISIRILRGLYSAIEPRLQKLHFDNTTLIKIPNGEYLSVSILPAGHCPGSVMFLFETDKTILYTGDYRANPSDIRKFQNFYSRGEVKKVHKLYLDTTFFNLQYLRLPSRQASLESMRDIIEDWIKQSDKHIIEIALSARYGSEYLFMELAKKLGMRIHVSEKSYQLYKYIPEMDKAITVNRRETQIHAGCGPGLKKICCKDDVFVRTIIPSVMWWEGHDFSKGIVAVTDEGKFRVCYSCHASLEELKGLLLFLEPVEVEPCVVPTRLKDRQDMMDLLEEIMESYRDKAGGTSPEEVKLFDTNYSQI